MNRSWHGKWLSITENCCQCAHRKLSSGYPWVPKESGASPGFVFHSGQLWFPKVCKSPSVLRRLKLIKLIKLALTQPERFQFLKVREELWTKKPKVASSLEIEDRAHSSPDLRKQSTSTSYFLWQNEVIWCAVLASILNLARSESSLKDNELQVLQLSCCEPDAYQSLRGLWQDITIWLAINPLSYFLKGFKVFGQNYVFPGTL